MDSITERQLEYIKILSSYEYSKEDDEADIATYLKEHNKQKVTQLSKSEASDLIQLLLRRPTEYTFVCGRKAFLHKKEVNCFNVLGYLEGCLHACPNEKIQQFGKGWNAFVLECGGFVYSFDFYFDFYFSVIVGKPRLEGFEG